MAKKTTTITVQGIDISITKNNEEDYISLTDMVKAKDSDGRAADIIKNWIRNRGTIEFLGTWETFYNPNFNVVEFDHFRKEAGLPTFTMSVGNWVDKTNAIGIFSRQGKYGGTYAHKDIAFEFGAAISPVFKLYLIKEFQRLKEDEQKQIKSSEWLYHRFTAKVNYSIQTDAIQKYLIPFSKLPKDKLGILYASEAELINYATLGYTSKNWAEEHSDLIMSGKNHRDYLPLEKLIVLDNMQGFNSYLISQNIPREKRFELIQREAIRQLEAITTSKSINKIEQSNLLSFDDSLKKALDYKPNEQ